MTKGTYKRLTLVGPGGMRCSCCAPQSGNKYAAEAIRKIKRQAVKRYGRVVDKDVNAELMSLMRQDEG